MKKILIDTDVLIDFLGERQPFVQAAKKIFSLFHHGKTKGYVTPVIIANAYYLLRPMHGDRKTREKIEKLLTVIDILSMDKDTVIHAIHSSFSDFEDALQNQAAENSGADTIITRNVKDYRKSKLAVMEPERFLKIFLSR